MKYKIILIFGILIFIAPALRSQMKITDNENLTINSNAILDLESDSLGLLLPRMAINDVNSPAPLTSPLTAGMVVYSNGGSVSDGAYVWNGSQWISLAGTGGNRAGSKSNYVLVESLSDFPAPSGGIISLEDNFTYEINGLVNIGSNTLQMGSNVSLYGDSKTNDILEYDGTGTMIKSADKNFNIRNLTLVSANAISRLFSVAGSTSVVQLNDNVFYSCHEIGNFDGGDLLIIKDNIMDNCSGGFELVGTFNQFLFMDNISRNNSDILVSIPAGNFGSIMIKGNYFNVPAGLTALNISSGIKLLEGFVSSNFFTGNGTYLKGINYYDPHWTFEGNTGM